MKRNFRLTALTLFLLALMTASSALVADDIVIDSGAGATIISSLPSAGEEENPVCSDAATGQLGNCSGALLGFYRISDTFDFDGSEEIANSGLLCDEGDLAVSGGYSHGLNPGLQVTATGVSGINDRRVFVDVYQPPGGSNITLHGICADYAPAHAP